MKNSRPVEYSKVITRHIIMPNDSNPGGMVFGGTVMSWIDLAAAMVAQRHSGLNVATVKVSEVVFESPMRIGDHAELMAKLIFVGNSSMIISVDVFVEGAGVGPKLATSAVLTLVGVDKNLKPTKVNGLELITQEDKDNFEKGKTWARQ